MIARLAIRATFKTVISLKLYLRNTPLRLSTEGQGQGGEAEPNHTGGPGFQQQQY